MMKFVVTTFVLFTLFLSENLALDAENYIAYIEELSHNETFLEEYTKWLSQPFYQFQRGYLFGDSHGKFPCPIDKSNDTNSIPTSVHTLRPSDIKCIGAMGDSFTTGLSAHGITPIDLLFEERGISWSVGGDYIYSQIPTIPNALRQYNPKLKGFSIKRYVMSANRQHSTNNRLNVAKSGDRSINMPHQAEVLINRLKDETLCDWKNDWKMITLFVGANDLCSFCEDSNGTNYTPEQYMIHISDTLDILYNASVPRMLVNLILTPDIRGIKDLDNDSYVCQTLLKRICPCAAFPTAEQAKTLDKYTVEYQKVLFDLIHSGRYEKRDDFTVVIQPFMGKTKLLYKDNNKIDFSYFAPDCFHFSGKGHSQAALSLWNNMLEPVGSKQTSWHIGESLKCPTKEHPYIFTSKNSAKESDEVKFTTMIQTTNLESMTNSSNNFTSDVNTTFMVSSNTSTSDFNTTTNRASTVTSSSISTIDVNSTSGYQRKHGKGKKSNSDSSFSKMKLFVITAFLFIIVMILIVGIMRRRKAPFILIPEIGRNNSNYLKEELDDDEVEIYNAVSNKSDYLDNNKITKTHGTRMNFE